MTESVVTVDWENGFVEASAKENINVTKVFKELLVQAKVFTTYKFAVFKQSFYFLLKGLLRDLTLAE